jgi:sec-independent protein translocase protein TatC
MADADVLSEASLPDQLPATVPAAPAPESPSPTRPTPSAPGDEKVMPLVDHLSELRTRIFRSILAVAAGAAVGFYFADPILRILIAPLPNKQLQTLGVGDAFFVYLKISLVTGIILAMPVLLYQGWAFISPGLTPRERKAVRPWIPLALVFFALGVFIAYLVLPYAVAFLQSFTNDVLVGNLVADRYFDFVTTMFLAFGLVMEFPIVLFGLARAGVVGSDRLKASRRYVILGTVIFAAVITPGGDLVSPMVLGLTMYALYEATIFVIARTGR